MPTVLIVFDIPGWALEHKARALALHLGRDHRCRLRTARDVDVRDVESADVIVVLFWWCLPWKRPLGSGASNEYATAGMERVAAALLARRNRVVAGVCSHRSIAGPYLEAAVDALGAARAAFVLNPALRDQLAARLDVPVFMTPNGVDTSFFRPTAAPRRPGPLRVGWAGSLENHGPQKRGFFDYIVPAVSGLDGVELVPAIREHRWRDRAQMREYYRSIDVYLCASRTEGGPNPCLEAAASGVPVLTTRVGQMPLLIEDGHNGMFVARDVADIQAKLRRVRDDPDLRLRLRTAMLESIAQWDWSIRARAYREMIAAVVTEQPASQVAL